MCSNCAPLDLVKHVVLTELLVKIPRERALICRECFLFLLKLSNTPSFMLLLSDQDSRFYSFSLIFFKFTNTIFTNKKLTNTNNELSWVVQDKLVC